MQNVFLVRLVTKEGKIIPVGIADSYENAEKAIEYTERLFDLKSIGEIQIISFPDYEEKL